MHLITSALNTLFSFAPNLNLFLDYWGSCVSKCIKLQITLLVIFFFLVVLRFVPMVYASTDILSIKGLKMMIFTKYHGPYETLIS